MAVKRKAKRQATPREDLSQPSSWRLQHGPVGEPVREADPETGLPVVHRRTVDTLGQMLANGTITQEMHDAGAVFRSQFRIAALDSLRAVPLLRLPAGSGRDGKSIQPCRSVRSSVSVVGTSTKRTVSSAPR